MKPAKPHVPRRRRALFRAFGAAVALGAFFSGFFAAQGAETPSQDDPEAFSRLYFGLQPPVDREAERRVELAEELLQTGRFGEAAPLVAERLAVDVDHVGSAGESLKRRLLNAVLHAGAADIAVMRKVLEGEHRRAIAEAKTPRALRRVVASYPPELFGVEALETLARLESDAGAYASAAAALQLAERIARHGGDRPRSQQLAAAEAVCRLRLGQIDRVDREIDPRIDEWIEATSAEAAAIAARSTPQAWLASGGDARRLARAPGEAPAPWRAWRAVIEDEGDAASDDSFSVPLSETVAVGGVVITNTADRLVALVADTGRRLWETPFPEDPQSWRSGTAATGISTDARLVFAVTPSSSSAIDPDAMLRRRFGDSLFGADPPTLPTNCLAAYEIASAGKLRWRIDGGDSAGAVPATRFLGAPAVADGRLYVLAESEQVVRLLEIDAQTGDVLWNQPIAQCQREPSPQAAPIAVSPTLGEQLVYCPTGRGAVAAVDPLRRRLEWLSYLEVDEEDARPAPQGGWGAIRDPQQWGEDTVGWRHCRVIESEGKLIVASPELPSLQAFDAATGGQEWRHDLPDGALVGAVVHDAVLVIQSDGVSAWRTGDGKSLWHAKLPAEERPAGEAVLVGQSLLLPLRSGAMALLEVSDPEAKPSWRLDRLDLNPLTESPRLGNLLYHGDAILSRSATTLECYPQPAALSAAEREAIAALATGDDALVAVDQLRKAVGAKPKSRRLAELLAVALLRSAEDDPTIGETVGRDLPTLVAGRRATAYASALRLDAAAARGDADALLSEARSLAKSRAADVLLRPEPQLYVVAKRVAASRARQVGADIGLVARLAGAPSGPFSTPPSEASHEGLARSLWTTRQVEASVESLPTRATSRGRGMRMRQDRGARMRPLSPQGELPSQWNWTYESRGGDWRLVGSNGWGERVFAEEAPGDPWSPGPDVAGLVGAPGDRVWGDWLALKLETGYYVCHAERGVVWEAIEQTASGDWPSSVAVQDPSEAPAAVGPWGVVSVAGATLRCRDLSTGELVWRRDVSDLGADALRVLSVGDELFVVGANSEGVRLTAWSGERVAAWQTPQPRSWRGFAGRMLLTEERAAGKRRFKIVPIGGVGDDAAFWESTFDLTTRFLLHEGSAVFFGQDRTLTMIDIATVRQRLQVALPGDESAPVRSVRLRTRLGRLLVEVDRSNPMVDRVRGASPIGADPLLTGELHCLDLQTGESPWGGPVEVDGMALMDTTATDAPLLVLARRRAADAGDDRTESQVALAVLDLMTGATLYRDHELPAGNGQEGPAELWAAYERAGGESLLVRAGRTWVTLQTTDQPAPPRPRMLARVEDPEASRLNGPDDIGRGVERLFKSFWEGDDD